MLQTSFRSPMYAAFDQQIAWCATPSPFTARLLGILLGDLGVGGDIATLLANWPGDPAADAVPLRLAAVFHFLVLNGAEPDLARLYPPHPDAVDQELKKVVLTVAARRRDLIATFLRSPPQTNEVGRSGVLLGGFLTVAQHTGLPLGILEIGASAGLNMQWDRYAYDIAGATWGDRLSPVHLAPQWTGPHPPLEVIPAIAGRAGCDKSPIDLGQDDQRLRLMSYIWPDQVERLTRIRAAIALCATAGLKVERADAADWLDAHLARDRRGTATVVVHSVMWQYLTTASQDRIVAIMDAAGAAARPDAPLAWLRFEPRPGTDSMELRLTLWPGPRDLRLAVGQAHGASVTWFGMASV